MPEVPYDDLQLRNAKLSIDATPAEGRSLKICIDGLDIEDIKTFEGARVLEVGSDAQRNFKYKLVAAGINADVVSFSPAFADPKWKIPKETDPKKHQEMSVAGMGEALPFKYGTFKKIICFNLVQHIDSDAQTVVLLSEIVRVLAEGGEAYVSPFFIIKGDDRYVKKIVEELRDVVQTRYAFEGNISATPIKQGIWAHGPLKAQVIKIRKV